MAIRVILCIHFLVSLFMGVWAMENGDVIETYKNQNGRKVEKIYWEETRDDYVLVSYPDDFDINKVYHLSFWFPGTTGKPSQGIEDENDHYVGVGLSYLDPKHIPQYKDAPAHWELCRDVEMSVVKRLKLKVGRRIVSGVSKGGWLAFNLSLVPPEGLHGVGIIAAGMYTSARYKKVGEARHLAVFVGTGETDSNFPFAQLAIPFFKEYEVESICYEEWLGQGHISKISPRVNEWLDLEARKGGSTKEISTYCDQVAVAKLADIDDITGDKNKYVALRHLLSSPCFHYISKEVKDKVMNRGRELMKSGSFKGWLIDFNKLKDMVKKESELYNERNIDSTLLKLLVNKYKSLAEKSEHDDIKIRAAYAYLRVTKLYASQKAQEKSREDPQYVKLHTQYESLKKQVTSKRTPPTQEIINEFQLVGAQVMKLRSKYSMAAFYDVEWHKKYECDPAMEQLMKKDKSNSGSRSFYSGVGY